MRDVPASLQSAWTKGEFIGDRRPIARATVQHPTMKLRDYNLHPTTVAPATGLSAVERAAAQLKEARRVKKGVNQEYADFLFTPATVAPYTTNAFLPRELPNIRSISWSRSVDTDVADCTITVWNTRPLPVGESPHPQELDEPGFYTYDRGGSSVSNRWGYTRNEWFGLLVPDNLIRTYEGYGCDPTQPPELDPHLVQTGLWIIDSVDVGTDLVMTIKLRDIGRILIDQQSWPTVIPDDFYDHDFRAWPGPTTAPATPSHPLKVTAKDSSNTPWIGAGKAVAGHALAHAFDADPNTYWLSIGNDRPSRRFAYEWVECSVNNQSVSEVRVRTKKKGYTCYVSVKVAGAWQGVETINYHRDGIGQNGGNIKYVKHAVIATEKSVSIKFKSIAKVEAVRVTLGNLQDFHFGTYHYRAGIRDVQVYGSASPATTVKTKTGPAGANPGRYSDYTDIVKLLLAWGGFFWPEHGKVGFSDGTYRTLSPDSFDTSVLGLGVRGRIWGDLMDAGVAGIADLDWSNFDKRPLMDGISYIRDILGFIFFIDESGGAQWRMPNIFNFGCQRSALSAQPGYVNKYAHVLDEKKIIVQLNSTIDSSNVREENFVGDAEGKIGSYAPGFNPNPTGLRRMGGYTDQNFATTAETQLMGDMISLAQLATYRTDRVRIPANPKIQIDDQVIILERVSAEGYVHYVKGISSSLDVTTGEWTYDLETHWLGMSPDTQWLFSPNQLYRATSDYIDAQAELADRTKIVDRRPS